MFLTNMFKKEQNEGTKEAGQDLHFIIYFFFHHAYLVFSEHVVIITKRLKNIQRKKTKKENFRKNSGRVREDK